jgi:hypothetical protein
LRLTDLEAPFSVDRQERRLAFGFDANGYVNAD